MNKITLVNCILILTLNLTNAYSKENDSLEVQFIGELKREYLWIIYDTTTLFKGYVKISTLINFKISIKDLDERDFIELYILRKPLFGLSYKDTHFQAFLKKDRNLLILFRDYRVKRKYIIPIWRNKNI